MESNFDDSPVLGINETPKIEVHIVPSSEAPGGIGEVGTPGVAPSLLNAIFVATGKRLRSLPIDHNIAEGVIMIKRISAIGLVAVLAATGIVAGMGSLQTYAETTDGGALKSVSDFDAIADRQFHRSQQ